MWSNKIHSRLKLRGQKSSSYLFYLFLGPDSVENGPDGCLLSYSSAIRVLSSRSMNSKRGAKATISCREGGHKTPCLQKSNRTICIIKSPLPINGFIT